MPEELTGQSASKDGLREGARHLRGGQVGHDATDRECQTIHMMVRGWAECTPDAVAIVAPGRRPLRYGELSEHIERQVDRLNQLGVGRGDRMATVLPDGPEMAVAFLAIASGATCVPLNPGYTANDIDLILGEVGARSIVLMAGSDSPARPVAAARHIPVIELVPDLEAAAGKFTLVGTSKGAPNLTGLANVDDIPLVLHTSGTTSRPKRVAYTHAQLAAYEESYRSTLDLTQEDRCLNFMPMVHTHGLVAPILPSLMVGGAAVFPPGFLAASFFQWLEELRPTWYTAAPTFHRAILSRAEAARDIIRRSQLRLIRSSSATLPLPLLAEMESVFGVPVIEAYGMTESPIQITSNPLPPRVRKPGSVGLPAGPEVRIMDEAGDLLPPNQIGEIVLRGPHVLRGYDGDPRATAAAFRNGWFRTGDLGHFDEDGYLFLDGRLTEIINRGGEKMSPREVDEALMAHPSVAQALAFSVPDSRLGQEVYAAVVLRPGVKASPDELRRFAAIRLTSSKVPARVYLVDEMPLGPTGKPQRSGLAEKLVGAQSGGRDPERGSFFLAPRTSLEEALAAVWREVLGVEKVSIRDRFMELGGDSLVATMLVSRIRSAMQVELSLIDFFDASTIEEQARIIERMRLRDDEDAVDTGTSTAVDRE